LDGFRKIIKIENFFPFFLKHKTTIQMISLPDFDIFKVKQIILEILEKCDCDSKNTMKYYSDNGVIFKTSLKSGTKKFHIFRSIFWFIRNNFDFAYVFDYNNMVNPPSSKYEFEIDVAITKLQLLKYKLIHYEKFFYDIYLNNHKDSVDLIELKSIPENAFIFDIEKIKEMVNT
jgi:hypothetical protein